MIGWATRYRYRGLELMLLGDLFGGTNKQIPPGITKVVHPVTKLPSPSSYPPDINHSQLSIDNQLLQGFYPHFQLPSPSRNFLTIILKCDFSSHRQSKEFCVSFFMCSRSGLLTSKCSNGMAIQTNMLPRLGGLLLLLWIVGHDVDDNEEKRLDCRR